MTDNVWLAVQALQPFIDPVTAKKVVFVSKDNEAALMPTLFPMEMMEKCLGGTGAYTYDVSAYSTFCRDLEASKGNVPNHIQHSPDSALAAADPDRDAATASPMTAN